MSDPTSTATLEVVLFDVGAYCVACPSDQVVAMLAAPPSDTWICLETLLGLDPKQCPAPRHYLQIYRKQGINTIALPSAPRIASLDIDCIHSLPLLLRQHNRLPALVALGFLQDSIHSNEHDCVLILDFRRL